MEQETTSPMDYFSSDWRSKRQAIEFITNFSPNQQEKLLSLLADLIRTQGDLRIKLQELREEIQKLNQ